MDKEQQLQEAREALDLARPKLARYQRAASASAYRARRFCLAVVRLEGIVRELERDLVTAPQPGK